MASFFCFDSATTARHLLTVTASVAPKANSIALASFASNSASAARVASAHRAYAARWRIRANVSLAEANFVSLARRYSTYVHQRPKNVPLAAPSLLLSMRFTSANFSWSTIWNRQPRHAVATSALRLRLMVSSPAATARFKACCLRKKRLLRCGMSRHPAKMRARLPNMSRFTTSASFASRIASSLRRCSVSSHSVNAHRECRRRQCRSPRMVAIQILNARRPTPAAEFCCRNALFVRKTFATVASSDQARSARFACRRKPLPMSCLTRSMVTVYLTHSVKHFCLTLPKNLSAAVLYFSFRSSSPSTNATHLSTHRRSDWCSACAIALAMRRSVNTSA